MSIGSFLCCPFCGDPVTVIRRGRVGEYGKRDSSKFYCTVCRKGFTAPGGQTLREAMGSLK